MDKENKVSVDKRAWDGFVETLASRRFCLKLLIAVLSKVNPMDSDPSQLNGITLDLAHLKIKMGITGNDTIKVLKNAIKVVMATPVEFEDERYITWRHFFEAPLIDKQERLVTVNVHPDFLPFITNLESFLTLKERVIGASNRSILFYATLKARHHKYPKNISIEELQDACKVNYLTYGAFKQKFLQPVIQDLKQNGIDISFKEHKIGRRVDNLSFVILEPETNEKTPEIETEQPLELKPPPSTSVSNNELFELSEYYRQTFNLQRCDLTPQRKTMLAAAIKKYGFANCKKAINKMKIKQETDQWLQDNASLEYLFRKPENTEKFLPKAKKIKQDKAPKDDSLLEMIEGWQG